MAFFQPPHFFVMVMKEQLSVTTSLTPRSSWRKKKGVGWKMKMRRLLQTAERQKQFILTMTESTDYRWIFKWPTGCVVFWGFGNFKASMKDLLKHEFHIRWSCLLLTISLLLDNDWDPASYIYVEYVNTHHCSFHYSFFIFLLSCFK